MKKIISLISAVAMLASFAANFSVFAETTYTEPTIYLDVVGSTTDLKAGDTVTIAVKYAGFDVSAYDDANTGNGETLDNFQAKVTLPGKIGTAADCVFKRGGSTIAMNTDSGSAAGQLTVNASDITYGGYGITDPMSSSGTLFTAVLVLMNDVTDALEFSFDTSYDNQIGYLSYTEWTPADATVTYNSKAITGTLPLALGDAVTLGEAAATKYAVTVTGGTADVTEAEEGQQVTVTADVPAGQKIKSVTGVEWDGSSTTFTFTMPAEAVTIVIEYEDVVIPFNVQASESATKYYMEGDKVVDIFNCTAQGANEATTWNFTFAKDGEQRVFTATDMPTIEGNASVVFDAWVVSVGGGVTFVSANAQ